MLDAIRPLEPGALGSIGGWFSNGGMEISQSCSVPSELVRSVRPPSMASRMAKASVQFSELRTWGP